MKLLEKQIKLGLYEYHNLDSIDNNNQSIGFCWFVEDNILKIVIDAYNKKNNHNQSITLHVETQSIEEINKIVSKFEDFAKELK
jgi:predicted 3-demethylubiquinone-9 3-methyltransferase (glyoxalase superfamily)